MLGTYTAGPPRSGGNTGVVMRMRTPFGLCGEERGRGAADGRTPPHWGYSGLKVNTFWWLALRSPSMASSTSRVMSPVG